MKIRVILKETITQWADYLLPIDNSKGAFALLANTERDVYSIYLHPSRGRIIDSHLCWVGNVSYNNSTADELLMASEEDAAYLGDVLNKLRRMKQPIIQY